MAEDGKMRRTMVLNLELLEAEIGFDVEGRRVESVAPRSIADGLLFTGDVILAVDGAEVSDDTVVAAMESKLEVLLTVLVGRPVLPVAVISWTRNALVAGGGDPTIEAALGGLLSIPGVANAPGHGVTGGMLLHIDARAGCGTAVNRLLDCGAVVDQELWIRCDYLSRDARLGGRCGAPC